MSRKGNCYDNATMETFWSTLKQELVYRRHFRNPRPGPHRNLRLHRSAFTTANAPTARLIIFRPLTSKTKTTNQMTQFLVSVFSALPAGKLKSGRPAGANSCGSQ